MNWKVLFIVLIAPSAIISPESRMANPAYASEIQQKQPKGEAKPMEVFAYCLCKQCCGDSNPGGKTATGKDGGKYLDGVAADPALLPYGMRLWIPGVGEKVVDDTGTKIRNIKDDYGRPVYKICFRVKEHAEVAKYGHKKLHVILVED